ncbi:intradiol ring-cleavage dioxygenase [Paucibacter sp. PLA-PC-4]|uniref:dioxygenase family protein n=1 Tax=Paucibacter sp. PLA-PC-4 TaxID=2993655 RepID=UPI00224AACC3|nr:intradiol ring-cleavage dioxygenase [Paucibacter sp. PLA-PC-4]MCX2865555.1 intradiol ring-cleavage dioxygenase [Paucibacter sp. PLA-PC-4]
MHKAANHDSEGHDHGLARDLARLQAQQLQQRRRAIGFLAGAGGLMLIGCGGGAGEDNTATTSTSDTGTTTGTSTTTSSCSVIPEETAGPYPGDGSNSVNGGIANALTLSGIVRSDIRTSIASASGSAAGVLLTLTLKLVNTNGGCTDLAGYAIYLWHCDAEGRYSMYSSGITAENYLRGVQQTGSDGTVSFTTIVPGCYAGRMPHVHFEVFRSVNSASAYSNKLKTSQIAFPTEVCSDVYNSVAAYSASIRNLAAISFASDNVFSDGVTTQLASMTGSVATGYIANLTVGIAA